jgi:hypothetical protein
MGAVVFLSLLASIPACALAAWLWACVAKAASAEEVRARISRAAIWTALALAFQALSFLGTAVVALTS